MNKNITSLTEAKLQSRSNSTLSGEPTSNQLKITKK